MENENVAPGPSSFGAAKAFGANVAIIMRNAADNVTEVMIADSGHWLMEKQPTAAIDAVRNVLEQKTAIQSHQLSRHSIPKYH
jgi:hypothetical protein